MAYSKTSVLFLGLLFAVMLVISSQVSARELAEATQTQIVEEAKHYEHGKGHGYGHGHGHGYGKGHGHGKPGHGGHPGHGAGETESDEN